MTQWYNVTGYSLALVSIALMFVFDSQALILSVGVGGLFIGAVLIGGLPSVNELKRVLNRQPAVLLFSIGLTIAVSQAFGVSFLSKTFLSFLVGAYVVQNIGAPLFGRSLEND